MPKNFFVDAHKLLVEGSTRVEIFTYRPENVERENLGGLYIVGELAVTGHAQPNDFFTLNSLASVIKREYYATPSDSPLLNLEEALKAANVAFGHLLKTNAPVSPHMIVAAVSGENLHFSRLGSAHVFLNRQGTWLNLSRVKTAAGPRRRRQQLFNNIVTGKIKNSDSLFIATHGLLPYIQQEKFRQRLSAAPFEDAAAFIQKSLARLGTDVSIGLLQLDIHESNPLRPPLTVAEFEGLAPRLEKVATPSSSPLAPAKTESPFGLKLRAIAAAAVVKSQAFLAKIKAGLKAKARPSALTAPLNHLVQGRPIGFFALKKNLFWAKMGRLVGGLIVVLGVIIILGAVLVGRQPSVSARLETEFSQIVERISINPPAAPAADWQRLNSIIMEVEALPESTELADRLKALESGLRLRASGATPVTFGQAVIKWSDLSFAVNPVGLLPAGAGQFLVYDNQSLIRATIQAESEPAFIFLPHSLEAVRAVTPSEAPGETVYLINPVKLTQGLIAHATGAPFETLALFKPYEKMTAVDGAFYNDRLYILDAERPQVLRYDPTRPENEPTLWLAAEAEATLTQPLAMAVDGTIFVAQRGPASQVTIRQYISGRQNRVFNLSAGDISTVTRMLTIRGSSLLYLLDAERGVLLALNKNTGGIERRFGSEGLQKALDFLVLANNQALVLNSQGVFLVELPQAD